LKAVKTSVLIFFIGIAFSAAAQPGVPGVKYKKDELITYYQEISKYQLQELDTLVDIGAGMSKHDGMIFRFYPHLYFLQVDIDQRFRKMGTAHVAVKGKTKWFRDSRTFLIGTDSTIPLRSAAYKRVLCRSTFHEFSRPEEMTAELHRILADDGILILEEAIPKFEGETDANCKSLYWSKDQLVKFFESHGFKLIWSDVTMYDEEKSHGNLNILKFKKG
jgi:SAM-dependent methyltransferase